MSQREIAIQLILNEVGKGHTIDEAVQRIINRPKDTQPMSGHRERKAVRLNVRIARIESGIKTNEHRAN